MPIPKTVQEVVASICTIPEDFHRRGDVSVVGLLADSGYAAFRDSIGVAEIRRHLESHPRLIGVWADYSSDKRSSSGWYFDDRRHLIGHYSLDAGHSREQQFSESSQACAEFIKHELDSILEHA